MPTQLLARLNRFLDPQHCRAVMAREADARVDTPGAPIGGNPPSPNTSPHWPVDFGPAMAAVQCVMIHETSGWPSYASARNFRDRFFSLPTFVPATATTAAHWDDKRGIGPQYFVDSNGTAFVLIGPENLNGTPRVTWHGEAMNAFTLGIENSSIGDSEVQPGAGNGPRWFRLSNDPQDLTGMKVFVVLHPNAAEDATLIWIAQFPAFTGSGDITDGNNPPVTRRLGRHPNWKNMLFTERDYRTLVLLCRLLAEQNGLPRNFPLLPYLDNTRDNNANNFRQLILSDQRRDEIAQKLGIQTAIIEANGPAYTNFYNPQRARHWSRFFGADPNRRGVADLPCFRGFLSHDINGSHPCPGPLFDWHRFAREVWDWWWYPFDFVLQLVAVPPPRTLSSVRRPYQQARLNTPLIEYYYDAIGTTADYNSLLQLTIVEDRFVLDTTTPVYALANGILVAARFARSSDPANSGFLLVRHEVFHQGVANRINYDLAPTYVWSLISFLSNAGFRTDQIGGSNPDWLDRFVIRLKECELAVAFKNANPGNNALNRGWAHNATGAGPRLQTGQEIERDAAAYRRLANELGTGQPVFFPLETQNDVTPVRVILGDFLGFPNLLPADEDAQQEVGIQVEIFSNDQLNVPNALRRPTSASEEDWWEDACEAIRHEGFGMDLPADGIAWHYSMIDFLAWVNGATWASEWVKYGAAGGILVVTPPRPITRRVN